MSRKLLRKIRDLKQDIGIKKMRMFKTSFEHVEGIIEKDEEFRKYRDLFYGVVDFSTKGAIYREEYPFLSTKLIRKINRKLKKWNKKRNKVFEEICEEMYNEFCRDDEEGYISEYEIESRTNSKMGKLFLKFLFDKYQHEYKKIVEYFYLEYISKF